MLKRPCCKRQKRKHVNCCSAACSRVFPVHISWATQAASRSPSPTPEWGTRFCAPNNRIKTYWIHVCAKLELLTSTFSWTLSWNNRASVVRLTYFQTQVNNQWYTYTLQTSICFSVFFTPVDIFTHVVRTSNWSCEVGTEKLVKEPPWLAPKGPLDGKQAIKIKKISGWTEESVSTKVLHHRDEPGSCNIFLYIDQRGIIQDDSVLAVLPSPSLRSPELWTAGLLDTSQKRKKCLLEIFGSV